MFEAIIRNGTLLAVAVLVFCVLAVAAALRMPVQMIPDLEVRTVTVDTVWPGATPQDIEKEILIEQERFLVLPHPQVATYFRRKAEDHDRWIGGMRRFRRRLAGEEKAADNTEES